MTTGALSASTKRIPSSTILDDRDLRHRLADAHDEASEPTAVLGGPDGIQRRPEHTDAVSRQHAGVVERDGQVEPGLPPSVGSSASGRCSSMTRSSELERQRPDDHRPANVRIGHHRRRVRVHEDRLDACLAQGQAGLDAGIVELGGLADEDRPRADHEDSAWSVGHACRALEGEVEDP
jgi:hypothetical protein